MGQLGGNCTNLVALPGLPCFTPAVWGTWVPGVRSSTRAEVLRGDRFLHFPRRVVWNKIGGRFHCRHSGAIWIRPGSLKWEWRVVVGQWATLKADHIFICRGKPRTGCLEKGNPGYELTPDTFICWSPHLDRLRSCRARLGSKKFSSSFAGTLSIGVLRGEPPKNRLHT